MGTRLIFQVSRAVHRVRADVDEHHGRIVLEPKQNTIAVRDGKRPVIFQWTSQFVSIESRISRVGSEPIGPFVGEVLNPLG